MRIGPGGIQRARHRVDGQCREDVVEAGANGPREDELGGPGLAAIRTARDEDVVEGRAGGLLDARLARGVDVEHIVRRRIGDDVAIVVVKGCAPGRAPLPDDGIAYSLEGKAVVG